jgi:beta-lactam-binding protein with PASTA domain
VTATATDANQASSSVSFTWTTLVTVPNVRGISKQKAAEEIHHAGLTLGPDSLNNQCIEVAGTVVDQSPNQGQLAPEGASVRLTVSRGLDSHGHKCPEEK